jgi:hypothetical protein
MSDQIRVAPHELPALLRKYRLPGGRVRRVRVLYPRPNEVAVEFDCNAVGLHAELYEQRGDR